MKNIKEKILLAALVAMLKEYDSADELGAVTLAPSEAVKQARATYRDVTGREWDPMKGNYANSTPRN